MRPRRPGDHNLSQDGYGGNKEKGRRRDDSVGFWSDELNATRSHVCKHWALDTLAFSTFILAVISLYWAMLFRAEDKLSSLVVYIVDFDSLVAPYININPIVGPSIVATAKSLIAPTGALGWRSLPASQFNFDPTAIRQAVYDDKAWAAVIINANATAILEDAVASGNVSYDPMGSAQIIYVGARDRNVASNYLQPHLQNLQATATSTFSQTWTRQVLSRASSNSTILNNIQTAPQTMWPAIGFSTFNLRPFSPRVATPALSIGLLYLIIISFMAPNFYIPKQMRFIGPGHRRLYFYQLVIFRWLSTVAGYLFLSLSYSLISLAFQIPFSTPSAPDTVPSNSATAYHYGSFPVYWMLNFVGMTAFGLACENVVMVVGQPWTDLWLIFWLVTNAATSFYSITLAPGFFRWAYAWPLYNIVQATRTILFDLHSKIGLNFGVLFAWVAVDTALFPFCCYVLRRKTLRKRRKDSGQRSDRRGEMDDEVVRAVSDNEID
ncbi:Uncharacterized protein BP5553_04294 [Venustampulla echinocandica]|uniref:DUF3533 domain-containing protein n=1 Tax=Venustampulla echinocandica TaxID=2656787 RepID=A0A370TWP6_9HELO|nr:Uncharacterized protein BP5553_04294 [Venustampulla echinocandica]RDL39954.1 Uncharacterized protein BP5553_04294 [Venustampulla echinocandica]